MFWHRGQATRVLASATAALPVAYMGWFQPGMGIPSIEAIAAAWMALNSRTLPGMKKHSMNPSTDVIPVQKKQQ